MLTEKEKEMLYNACLAYGNTLSETAKKMIENDLAQQIADKGKEYYELAQKIVQVEITENFFTH